MHYRWPVRTRLVLALIAYGLFWMMLLVRTFQPRRRLTQGIMVTLILWVTLGVSVAADWRFRDRPTDGVLVAEEVVVRKGDGEGYDPQFTEPLHEGVEFTVLKQRRGWVHIELPDGNRGWIRDGDAILF